MNPARHLLPHRPSLAFDRVAMEFPGVKALTDVSFDVRAGSVHALMGENGAGKSTLLKILSGAYRPTSGSIVIDDKPRVFENTSDALAAGVAVIYQELHLVPEMTVAENLFLGHLPQRMGLVNRRELLSPPASNSTWWARRSIPTRSLADCRSPSGRWSKSRKHLPAARASSHSTNQPAACPIEKCGACSQSSAI